MTTRKALIISVVIIIVAAALYGYKQYTRKNKDLAHTKADIEMKSESLVAAFEKSEQEANKQFLDKIIAVSGMTKEVVQDDKGYYTIVLGEKNSLSSVRCSMDSSHQQNLQTVKPGDLVTIKGVCTGFNADELLGSDVILNRGVLAAKN